MTTPDYGKSGSYVVLEANALEGILGAWGPFPDPETADTFVERFDWDSAVYVIGVSAPDDCEAETDAPDPSLADPTALELARRIASGYYSASKHTRGYARAVLNAERNRGNG